LDRQVSHSLALRRTGPSQAKRVPQLARVGQLASAALHLGSRSMTGVSPSLPNDPSVLAGEIQEALELSLPRPEASNEAGGGRSAAELYKATALSVRRRLVHGWVASQRATRGERTVCYLSMEFLLGRSLSTALHNLGVKDEYEAALSSLGYKLEDIVSEEQDAALGNGGLGRLASCFLDSLSTQNYPAYGYGIRYKYGLFRQGLRDGCQVEYPEYWLEQSNPWEIERKDIEYEIPFFGRSVMITAVKPAEGSSGPAAIDASCVNNSGNSPLNVSSVNCVSFRWEPGEVVIARAYDWPIPGYGDNSLTNTMRLWSSLPADEFDLASFNDGRFLDATTQRSNSESISSVLYPNDNSAAGKQLRLKQQFFFCSATLQDVIRRLKSESFPLSRMHEKVAIQLNDTHPTIAIPELMRLLIDIECFDWDTAYGITNKVFAYTNHTIMPEALERWPVPLIQHLLPRHMEIIYEINHRFLQAVQGMWPEDVNRLRRMSIIEESSPKMVRMATLALVASHACNGVAVIHSKLVKSILFPDFVELWPEKFYNCTNGITPRRWLLSANSPLSRVITDWLGTTEWATNLSLMQRLRDYVSDPKLKAQWQEAKACNKRRLAAYLARTCNVDVDTNAMFDVHIKRIHEYKRQLLNVLAIIYRYCTIKELSPEDRRNVVPKVYIISGKAAPGYQLAKKIIQLLVSVSNKVNSDPDVGSLLKVIFIPNYNVSVAEMVIPACDLTQQISTAGMEASGTGNMKFVLNGSLLVGTLDGANVEIAEEIAATSSAIKHDGPGIFIFGARAEETDRIRKAQRDGGSLVLPPEFHKVLYAISGGLFGPGEMFRPILDIFTYNKDNYLLGHDFVSYLGALADADKLFAKPSEWVEKCIIGSASMGKFSSDRTIAEYAQNIWGIKRVTC